MKVPETLEPKWIKTLFFNMTFKGVFKSKLISQYFLFAKYFHFVLFELYFQVIWRCLDLKILSQKVDGLLWKKKSNESSTFKLNIFEKRLDKNIWKKNWDRIRSKYLETISLESILILIFLKIVLKHSVLYVFREVLTWIWLTG